MNACTVGSFAWSVFAPQRDTGQTGVAEGGAGNVVTVNLPHPIMAHEVIMLTIQASIQADPLSQSTIRSAVEGVEEALYWHTVVGKSP
jgi:hypothetical protein